MKTYEVAPRSEGPVGPDAGRAARSRARSAPGAGACPRHLAELPRPGRGSRRLSRSARPRRGRSPVRWCRRRAGGRRRRSRASSPATVSRARSSRCGTTVRPGPRRRSAPVRWTACSARRSSCMRTGLVALPSWMSFDEGATLSCAAGHRLARPHGRGQADQAGRQRAGAGGPAASRSSRCNSPAPPARA